MTVPGSSVVICVSSRWCHFQGGMPRPFVHTPFPWLHPHAKTVSLSEMRRNVKRKVGNCITSLNLIETQNKSSVANKWVDMAMENMYCKIIAFAPSHLYFAILHFCLQLLIFVCNSLFLFTKSTFFFSQYFYFHLQNFNSLANICSIILTP